MKIKTNTNNQRVKEFIGSFSSYLILIVFTILTLFVTYFLYTRLQEIFKQKLQSRIIAIATTASVMFDEKELSKIKGPENVGSDAYDKTIALLQQIRERNKQDNQDKPFTVLKIRWRKK